MTYQAGHCENCARYKTCGKFIGLRFGFCNTDFVPSDEFAICTHCGKITPFTDEGGRCETYDGWLCNECIAALKAEGVPLRFEDDWGEDW